MSYIHALIFISFMSICSGIEHIILFIPFKEKKILLKDHLPNKLGTEPVEYSFNTKKFTRFVTPAHMRPQSMEGSAIQGQCELFPHINYPSFFFLRPLRSLFYLCAFFIKYKGKSIL